MVELRQLDRPSSFPCVSRAGPFWEDPEIVEGSTRKTTVMSGYLLHINLVYLYIFMYLLHRLNKKTH